MKKLSKDDVISYVSVLVIVISLASIGMRLTGYANVTDTAVVNVTIDSKAALNFTVDFLDFGNGTVDNGQAGAYLYTNGTAPVGGTWSDTLTHGLTLENIGNTNLTLEFYANVDADSFLGGSSPLLMYAVEENETDACQGGIDLADGTTYRDLNTTNITLCSTFPFDNDMDELNIDIMLYVPEDSFIGERTATITAVGYYN